MHRDRPMMKRSLRSILLASLLVATMGAFAPSALASQLIDRNATGISIQLNGKGEALITYKAEGRLRHVLAWGAVNARPPALGVKQVKLQLDYAGGYGKYFKQDAGVQRLVAQYAGIRRNPGYQSSPVGKQLRQAQQTADTYWKTGFHGGCEPYDGPKLSFVRLEYKAADGSYWAIQSWQRELPDYGVTPAPSEAVWELRLAHWTGPLPVLTVHTDWSWDHQYDHLFGSLFYLGRPAFGFRSTSVGNPLDSYGRNVYIDTFNSIYGAGWRRENSALTHKETGAFCYSFNGHPPHPAGKGSRYRVTVIGPGVTPDVTWQGPSPGTFDPASESAANAQIDALHDGQCHAN